MKVNINNTEKMLTLLDSGESRQVDAIVMLQDMDLVAYGNTRTTAYFDGDNYYNESGQLLRDPDEYNQWSEGYTPFGDE